jgi:hypothetical protein
MSALALLAWWILDPAGLAAIARSIGGPVLPLWPSSLLGR